MMKKSEVLEARSTISKYDSKRLVAPTPGLIKVDDSSRLAIIFDPTLSNRFSSITLQGIAPFCPVPDFILRKKSMLFSAKEENGTGLLSQFLIVMESSKYICIKV